MKVYTIKIKVVATTEDELDDVINEIRTCNSDTLNVEFDEIKVE